MTKAHADETSMRNWMVTFIALYLGPHKTIGCVSSEGLGQAKVHDNPNFTGLHSLIESRGNSFWFLPQLLGPKVSQYERPAKDTSKDI